MLDRLPEKIGNSESDEVPTVDSDEDVGIPHDVSLEDNSSSEGEPSPDDQDGAGEEDPDPGVVVLRPIVIFGSCVACGSQAIISLLGRPDALSVFEALLHSERLNLLCTSCGEEIDPINSHDV